MAHGEGGVLVIPAMRVPVVINIKLVMRVSHKLVMRFSHKLVMILTAVRAAGGAMLVCHRSEPCWCGPCVIGVSHAGVGHADVSWEWAMSHTART